MNESYLPPDSTRRAAWLMKLGGIFKHMHCPHCENILLKQKPLLMFTQTELINNVILVTATPLWCHVSCSLSCLCVEEVFHEDHAKRHLKDRLAETKHTIRTRNRQDISVNTVMQMIPCLLLLTLAFSNYLFIFSPEMVSLQHFVSFGSWCTLPMRAISSQDTSCFH